MDEIFGFFPPVANPPSKQPMLTLLKQARAFGVGVVITERWDEALEEFEEMPVTPRRSDIDIDLFALAWAPHWRITYQDRGGITRTDHTGMKCPCYTAVPDESGCWRLLR